MIQVDDAYTALTSERKKKAIRIQSEILRASGDFLRSEGFVEILPVVISPLTDPLRHATGRAVIEYYDYVYQLTRSMIFHKQIAMLLLDKIFCYSPNIRLEPVELADTGRHLIEFVQLDLEVKGAGRDEVMDLGERLVVRVLEAVKAHCARELEYFNRTLPIPSPPFERIRYQDAYEKYGSNYEAVLSQLHTEPFWIIDVPIDAREFYDREDEENRGYLVDMDLVYPEGYGEALSGGEREWQYERILARIQRQGLNPADFALYLEFARRGLPKSAGFGIGIERFTRYVCGLKRIEDAALFPKPPGMLAL